MTLLYILYTRLSWRWKGSPSLIVLQLFEMIWNTEYQKNEYKIPDQSPFSIRFNQILKAFRLCPNVYVLRL